MNTDASRTIFFVQHCPYNGHGGGAKIMRFLIQNCPYRVVIINTDSGAKDLTEPFQHIALPDRPYFGKLETIGRIRPIIKKSAKFFRNSWRSKFQKLVEQEKPIAIHSVEHSDQIFASVQRVAEGANIPHFISFHDDNAVILKNNDKRYSTDVKNVWNATHHRFVISSQMGQEYNQRYGTQDYTVVTDGLDVIASTVKVSDQFACRFYFTGLLHLNYEPNFQDLLQVIGNQRDQYPNAGLVSRGGYPRKGLIENDSLFEYRDFVADLDYQLDTKGFDFLFLPLPFDPSFSNFVRFSLSTKMITYLNMGLPILYYGPKDSALCQVLKKHNAAIIVDKPDIELLEKAMQTDIGTKTKIVDNALKLAQDQFSKDSILERFYNPIRSIEIQ